MLRRVALVRTGVSEKFSASFIRVTRIGEVVYSCACVCARAPCHNFHANAKGSELAEYVSTERSILIVNRQSATGGGGGEDKTCCFHFPSKVARNAVAVICT
jgi:hypothetical protein